MLTNINDILFILDVLSKHNQRKKILYLLIKRPPSLLLRPFDYDSIFEFGLCLNLYKEKNKMIILSNHGSNIIKMRKPGLDLTTEQKEYMAQNCIFENNQFPKIQELLRKFTFQTRFSSFAILDDRALQYSYEIMILSQFGILKKIGRFWIIELNYIDYIQKINQGFDKLITDAQLEKILSEQKRIGNMAEDLTVKYEISRLKKQKLIDQSKRIQKISSKYVNKGYDIESFSSKSKNPNLFIEVKARKYNLSSFIISINEVQTAMKLKNKYAIYFWNNVGDVPPPKEPFKIVRDPFKKLELDKCENCLSFLIEL